MNLFHKIASTLLLLVAVALPSLSQAPPTSAPTLEQSRRVILLMAGTPGKGADYVASMGLSDTGASTFLSGAQTFYNDQLTAVNASNQAAEDVYNMVPGAQPPDAPSAIAARDASVDSTWNSIKNQLSGTDQDALYSFRVAESNSMDVPSGGDMVAYQKWGFVSTKGDDGGDESDGFDIFVYIDGYSGAPPTCTVNSWDTSELVANYMSTFAGTVPSGMTQFNVSSTDGTILARTSTNALHIYNTPTQSFLQLPGAGKEITGSLSLGVYTIGTDNKLYAYDTWNNAWLLVSGAGYPFTTATHVAADGEDYSLFATNAGTVAAYIPLLGHWVTLGHAPVSLVSITTHFVSSNTAVFWAATAIGSDGKFYRAAFDWRTQLGAVNLDPYFSGYTGTPQTIKQGADGSFFLHTSDGKNWFAKSDGVFSQVTQITGSAVSYDGPNGFYGVGTGGSIVSWAGDRVSGTYSTAHGNHYLHIGNDAPFSGFLDGNPVGDNTVNHVEQKCLDVTTILMDVHKTAKVEFAKTLVFQPVLQERHNCNNLDVSQSCATYGVTEDCLAATNPPDLFAPQIHTRYFAGGTGDPVPWGFLETDLCYSSTGRQPYSCLTAFGQMGDYIIVKNPSPAYACTAHH